MSTLTSANSILSIAVTGLFNSPQTIQGYAVDDAFESESVAQSEVLMGVDGRLSGGKVFTPYKMSIHLQADSPSIGIFDAWRNTQDAVIDVFTAQGSIIIPGTGRVYTLQKGFLTMAPAFPDVKKILQPMAFEITWERIIAAPTA
jgi:hypothetical protein